MRAFSSVTAPPARMVARASSGGAAFIGVLALAGWTFDVPALKSAAPGFIAMQPWTAVAILLAAAALALASFLAPAALAASVVSAIAVAAVVGAPLYQYATGAELGTDLWLFPQAALGAQTLRYPNPGRMSPATATALAALAGALLLAPRAQGRAGRAVFSLLASVGLALTMMTAVSYILHMESLDNTLQHNAIAIPTALAIAALSIGALALRPDAGWVRVVAARGVPGWAAAGMLGCAAMLLVFGSGAAVTAGMVARDVAETALRLETLRATLVDAETGQRGYLLTGKSDYLQPYDAALARVASEMAAAEAALAKIENAPPELKQMRGLIGAKMTELAASVALRRAGDAVGALAVVETGQGKAVMDSIRAMTDGFGAAMRAPRSSNVARAELAAAIAASGATGLGALAFWALIAAGRVRREADEMVAESQARQRDLLATLSLGTFMARDLGGSIRYWAEGCARLYGWTAGEATGKRASDLLGTVFPVPFPEIEAALERSGEWTGDLRQHTRDGRELLVTARKVIRRGAGAERPVVLEFLTDVTALRHAEVAVADSRALMQTVIETSPGLIYAKDLHGRILLSNRAVATLVDKPAVDLHGRTDQEFLDHAEQAAAVMRNDRRVMETGVSQEFEERAGEADGRPRIWLSTKAPMRDASGEVIGVVGVSIEITARKQAEDRLLRMVDELSHRVKNTLVAVQAIAAQSLRGADPRIFRILEGRLKALAAVHDVLTRESWKDADLHEAIGHALAPFAASGEPRLRISGPTIRLQPRVAVTLSMALHELATNAVEYGAWSTATGRVSVCWEITRDIEPHLIMIWSEEDGPSVTAPRARGSGARMIERGLAHDLGGTAQIEFNCEGLTCTIDAPLDGVVAAERIARLPRVGSMEGDRTWP